ncbi:MAG: arylsulfatase, partial [Verrucomicrobia bacterium]|nr:arylsulfatase [Verrucomicrobiota bacterium]
GASAEIMVRNGGHDPQAEMGSEATFLCLGPGFSSAANTPHRRHKTWVHEGGISTPLIAHWPAGISAQNELRHTPAHVVDIVPTIIELAGLKKPTDWKGVPMPEAPGKSLVAALKTDITIAQHNLASQMPDKVKELTQSWEKQLAAYSELAQKTLSEQTKGKAGKGKKGKGKDVDQE